MLEPTMLTVPNDLRCPSQLVKTSELTLTSHTVETPLPPFQVFVTMPTFVLVDQGQNQVTTNGSDHLHTAGPGCMLALRPGAHTIQELPDEQGRYQSRILSIDRSYLRKVLWRPTDGINEGPQVVVSSPSPEARALVDALPQLTAQDGDDMEREYRTREVLAGLMDDPAVGRLILRDVAEWGESPHDRIVAIMQAHCLAPLTDRLYAVLCSMSLSTFKRHFRQVYGCTPRRWLATVRLEHARDMLLHGDAYVAEVAAASGFADTATFIRAFHRMHGTSPLQYRLRHQVRLLGGR